MKCHDVLRLALALLAGSCSCAHAGLLHTRLNLGGKNPTQEVANLLADMKSRIEGDGKKEQQSYDKYSCWVEQTLARKATDISEAKRLIRDLEASIVKVKAEVASHGAEIRQLERDIAANKESQREASSARNSENGDFENEKTESEQCAGALEAAVTTLTGAGAGKRGFLETMKQAQLLSMAASVRSVLSKPSAVQGVSDKDLELMHRFVEKPADFVAGAHGTAMSAAQVGNNPFGDYAPQSTQIQGILKGMYDTFVSRQEKSNSEEADAQKAFEALMATKLQELATLDGSHQQHKLDEATKSKKLADDMELLDDTKVQLDADEKFFEETKENGQVKAAEWSTRCGLRTEELQGIIKAIQILTSPEAKATFRSATTTFVQLKSVIKHESRAGSSKAEGIYGRLSALAGRFHSLGLAELAVSARSGGHFDKVMVSIDKMISNLRKEEQDDIEHRDRCQNANDKNENDMQDISHHLGKAEMTHGSLTEEKGRLEGEILALEQEIASTKSDMQRALDMRNDAVAEFRQAMKDDTDAVGILQETQTALMRFYKENRIPISLVAKSSQGPEYSVDQDEAPETTWDGGDYGGRNRETNGILNIIEMIIEDTKNEMKTSRADEAKAQKLYEAQRGSMQESLNAQRSTKMSTERDLADTKSKLLDTEEYMDAKANDLNAEQRLDQAITQDCTWVRTNFDSRREKRQSEIAGLQEAKSYLAGAESGEDVI